MSGLHNGTSPFRVGSLYAGVGGICLGFKNAGFEMAWANEWDARACQTYRHNFDHRLIEGDVWKVDLNSLEKGCPYCWIPMPAIFSRRIPQRV